MALAADDLKRLSELLDTALDLDAAARERWLEDLPAEMSALSPLLRQMLAQHGSPETHDVVDRSPFAAVVTGAEFAAGALIGPYRLQRRLGEGGMGEVWLAERADGHLKRPVALKLPTLSLKRGVLVQRFARERDILASLQHAHIARLYDAGLADDGQPWLALEYVEGVPIDAWCRDRAADVDARLALLLQVADAVAYAHSRLVLHRDLKPANILVTETGDGSGSGSAGAERSPSGGRAVGGHVKLLDFGIAKLMEGESAAATELTRLGGRALTLEYASPEQLRGEALGTASDVFSLGVVAFELLALERPWRHGPVAEAAGPERRAQAIVDAGAPLASRAAGDPALRARLRGELDAILAKALQPSAAARYASVDALANDLRAHLRGESVSARADTPWTRALRASRRHRKVIGVGAGAAAVLGVGLGAGATAVVVAAVAAGAGVAAWQARTATRARDAALRTLERDEAVMTFFNMLLVDAARGGGNFTAQQLLERSEQLVEREYAAGGDVPAVVLSMIAMSMHTLGDLGAAVRLNERALAAAGESADAALLDTLRGNWALSIGWSGRADEARAVLQEILARDAITIERRTEFHHYLSQLAAAVQDTPAALLHAEQALQCLRRSKRPSRKLEASLLSSLGMACSMNRRIVDAERHFAAAFARVQSLGLEQSAQGVTMLNNWAVVNERAGDARRTLELCERARAAEPSDAPRSPFLAANRARALEHLGRYDDAEPAYQEALAIALRNQVGVAVELTRIGLASLALQRGDADAAERLLAEAGPAEAMALPNRMQARLLQGRIAAARGDDTRAEHCLGEVVVTVPGMPAGVLALVLRAELRLRRGELDAAHADAAAATTAAAELQGDKPHSFRGALAAFVQARVLAAQRSPEATAAAARAVALLEAAVDPAHPALRPARELARGGGRTDAA